MVGQPPERGYQVGPHTQARSASEGLGRGYILNWCGPHCWATASRTNWVKSRSVILSSVMRRPAGAIF